LIVLSRRPFPIHAMRKISHCVSPWCSFNSPYWAALRQWEQNFHSYSEHNLITLARLVTYWWFFANVFHRESQPPVPIGSIFQRQNWQQSSREIFNSLGCVLY
jgi:hypothetical protein